MLLFYLREKMYSREQQQQKKKRKKEEDLIECRLYALHHVELAKNTGTKDDC